MFSSLISNINLKNTINTTDLKTTITNSRQTRPFEIVRCGSSSNLDVQPGYQGINILKDSYFFPNITFDSNVILFNGDRILLYGQTDPVQNGIWVVMSIVSGYVNIQRPPDYAKNTPIRSGQCVLITEGLSLAGIVFKNITSEYDSNQNKIINYNGTLPQYWDQYFQLNVFGMG